MFYLSAMLGMPVYDSTGEKLGIVSDLAISTGEVFPRITSLAFKGPGRTPFMISWRKYVEDYADDKVVLNTEAFNIRFSYLQPREILLARDLLDKQIVDTQGLKIVRVNDLKISPSGSQLRLLGAEVGVRGILRGLHPLLEKAVVGIGGLFNIDIKEQIIAWNYMDLLDRDLSKVQLSVTHKRLEELHPADVADILEQLDPRQRAEVFRHLDAERSAEVIAELEDEFQAEALEDLDVAEVSGLLGHMDPDDAADIIRDLPYEKAERLLRLMGVDDAAEIRSLLGYKDDTAGGMMTTRFVSMFEDDTVGDTIEVLRGLDEDFPTVHYVYVLEEDSEKLTGILSLRTLVLAQPSTVLSDIMFTDVITVDPNEDEDEVAADISKYDMVALPVVDESGHMLGLVTVDDAIEVIEDSSEDEKAIDTFGKVVLAVAAGVILLFLYTLLVLHLAGVSSW
ncbi:MULTISPECIES: magnesium transporter MgtE N-terminal domain-containing protein [Slackia]|uniref:magnesium transporter MgtE N-terminal domain-containing protein n=1 Tax=Slackia TaxID=84108 RepID=UPI00027C6BDD|nr:MULTISPECIES: CBS domain-containing protein [Slackia]EJU31972.1 MgtE intracellular N-terminal domain protein [Slackia sp. CM382]MCK6138423.1 CBS domain-containing protein [Slackia exigua]STN99444.1 Magnesium transporter mgtE [Slackia exigua]